MKFTCLFVGAMLFCPFMALSASEQDIRAETEIRFKNIVARYSAALDGRVQQEYRQIVADAGEIRPELQVGYIRDRYAEAQAIKREQVSAYAEKIWAILSNEMDKAIEDQRWVELNRKLDHLQATVADDARMSDFYRRQAAEATRP